MPNAINAVFPRQCLSRNSARNDPLESHNFLRPQGPGAVAPQERLDGKIGTVGFRWARACGTPKVLLRTDVQPGGNPQGSHASTSSGPAEKFRLANGMSRVVNLPSKPIAYVLDARVKRLRRSAAQLV